MACQHNCLYCTFKNKERTASNLDFERLVKILTELHDNGCKSILWSGGGDPSLYRSHHYDLKDILLETNRIGLKQGVYTNGESLTADMMEAMIKCCTFVRFSLDAFSKKTHQKLHGSNCYHQILENINYMLCLKRQYHSKINIGVSYVTYRENTIDILRINRFLKDFSPSYIYFRPGIYHTRTKIFTRLQRLILANVLHRYNNSNTTIECSDIKYENVLHPTKKQYQSCFAGSLFPTLGSDGKVYNCCHHIQNSHYELGDIYCESIPEIFRRAHVTNDIFCCPVNCRGDILNRDIENYLQCFNNPNTDFL